MNIEYRTRNVEQQKFFKRNKLIFFTSTCPQCLYVVRVEYHKGMVLWHLSL